MVQVKIIPPKILVSSFLSFSRRWRSGSLGATGKPELSTSSELWVP